MTLRGAPFHVVFLRTIGCGKSTIALELSKRLNLKLYKERVKKNPFLNPFYREKKRWSFTLQMECLRRAYRDHIDIIVSEKGGIQDYFSVYANHPFINTLKNAELIITPEEELYHEFFQILANPVSLSVPNVVVSLDVSKEECLKRIKKRGRKMEKNITIEDLQSLEKQIQIEYDKLKRTTFKNSSTLFCEVKNQQGNKNKVCDYIVNCIKRI